MTEDKDKTMPEDMKPLSKACPTCRGRGGECPTCDGSGWVKGSGWDQLQPDDEPRDL
jgi:hypothetical protein